ncbi:MAG: hypothetical protein J6Y19_02255, partial [Kiritimatiellae bacterium]|nr:hypothetical protein [Kiritimatiellia bacterium]
MRAVLSPSISFFPLLDVLEQYPCALAKTDVPYMPESFPDAIPIGKDVDVICREGDLSELSDKLAAALAKQTDFGIVRKKTVHGMQVRVEYGKATLFIVDLIARVPELADGFVEEAIAAKVAKNRYWVLSDSHEFVYRLCAYEKSRKPYHRDWLVQHAANVEAALLHHYVAADTLRRLQAMDEPLATLLSHGKD